MSYTLYEVGSSCVPFIKNPHDVDLFIINATEQEKKDILDNYRKAYNCHYVSNHDSAELFQPVLYGLVPY